MIDFTIDANIFNLEALVGIASAWVTKKVVKTSIRTANTNATTIRSPVKSAGLLCIAPRNNARKNYKLGTCPCP